MNNQLLKKLEKLDRENLLEVEDILSLINKADQSIILQLKDLSLKRNWQEVNDNGIIPFATWANIVCDYLSGGIEKITIIGLEKNKYSNFALAVLEEIKDVESVKGLSKILAACDLKIENDYRIAIKSLASINQLISFNKNIDLSSDNKEYIRRLIESKLVEIDTSKFKTETDIAICLCSLREIGNEETINKIKNRSLLKEDSFRGF